jgi:hypothetical protein
MTDPSDREHALIAEVLRRFGEDGQRTFGQRRNELLMHAVAKLFAGLMVTASGPEMLDLANRYLAQTAKDQTMTHAAQLHLVLVSDLFSDEASMY